MFPMGGMDPRQMQKMMKQLGIKSEEIAAGRVLIELDGKNIVILEPQVTVMEVQGKRIYTITGDEKLESKSFPQEDIELVAKQASVPKEKALAALKKNNGDIAEAIMELKEQ